MEKIATSFCSFEVLRRRYTYVDKTDMLWRLVADADDRMFFISCPRRRNALRLDYGRFNGLCPLIKGVVGR